MVRMTDTPLDVAMSLSKQELARQVVDANASLAEKDDAIHLLNERCAQYERRAEQAERALNREQDNVYASFDAR